MTFPADQLISFFFLSFFFFFFFFFVVVFVVVFLVFFAFSSFYHGHYIYLLSTNQVLYKVAADQEFGRTHYN